MLDISYTEEYTEQFIKEVLGKLTDLGSRYSALTGISFEEALLYYIKRLQDKF